MSMETLTIRQYKFTCSWEYEPNANYLLLAIPSADNKTTSFYIGTQGDDEFLLCSKTITPTKFGLSEKEFISKSIYSFINKYQGYLEKKNRIRR